MLYEITIDGTIDTVALLNIIDATAQTDTRRTVLRCRVPDPAGLTGVMVTLNDAGLTVRQVRAVPDVQPF